MALLIAIICIILVVVFWRIFIPLALIVAVGVGFLFLYIERESGRSTRIEKLEKQKAEQKAQEAEQAVRQRIANAKATAGNVVRQWEISSETDPASGAKVPRYASVLSDDGLCRLQVEQRMNGIRLTGIYCSGLKVWTYNYIEIKFDNRSTSDRMTIHRFSDVDAVYIPSQDIYNSSHAYDEFLRRITGANKVALLLTVEGAGQHWFTFSLTGSSPALTEIGVLTPGGSGTRRQQEGGITPNLPANAKLNVLGNDWECVRGYRRSGNECVVVQLPPNAKLNVLGNDWECQRGFRQSGSMCVPVQLPSNAKLNVLGNDWVCSYGYRQLGNECVLVAGSSVGGR